MAQGTAYFDFLRTYAAAMPRAYRIRYDAFSVADHARTAFERGTRSLNASTFRAPTRGATPLCVVGDDHSTIVAALSRAAVLTRFDIVAGEAYPIDSRLGLRGVVALFWLERGAKGGALRNEEAELLVDLVVAIGNRNGAARRAALDDLRRLQRSKVGTRVRFLEGLDGNLSVLEVETSVRSGLLPTLVDVLVRERVEIVHCEVQAMSDRVRDRFRLVDQNGGSLEPSRWRQIQVHVLDAIARAAEPAAIPAF